MDKTTITKYIKTYIRRVKKEITPEKIIVYGSFLTDRFSEKSDIDLLVISSDFNKMNPDERFDLLYKKTLNLPIDFHVYGFTPDEIQNVSPLTTLYEAVRKGVTI